MSIELINRVNSTDRYYTFIDDSIELQLGINEVPGKSRGLKYFRLVELFDNMSLGNIMVEIFPTSASLGHPINCRCRHDIITSRFYVRKMLTPDKHQVFDLVEAGATITGAHAGVAARHGHIGVVQYIVENLSDPVDLGQMLVQACAGNHLDIVKYLLDAGANIHHKKDLPLVTACNEDHQDLFYYLLDNSADLNEAIYNCYLHEYVKMNAWFTGWLFNDRRKG